MSALRPVFIGLCCLFMSSQSAGADQLGTSETVYIDGKPCGTFCQQFFPDDVVRRARRLAPIEERTESRSTYHATARRVLSHETIAHKQKQKHRTRTREAERRRGPSNGDGQSSEVPKQLHPIEPSNVRTDPGVNGNRSVEPPASEKPETTEGIKHEEQTEVQSRHGPD